MRRPWLFTPPPTPPVLFGIEFESFQNLRVHPTSAIKNESSLPFRSDHPNLPPKPEALDPWVSLFLAWSLSWAYRVSLLPPFSLQGFPHYIGSGSSSSVDCTTPPQVFFFFSMHSFFGLSRNISRPLNAHPFPCDFLFFDRTLPIFF